MDHRVIPRNGSPVPVMSVFLAGATLIVSSLVAWSVNGTPFSTVNVRQLAEYGGMTLGADRPGEVWRLAAAQLVHAKWPHMLFNVMCLGAVGALIEPWTGRRGLFFVWLVCGGLATLISPIFVAPPYNVGTGASQAVLAYCGVGLVLIARGRLSGPGRIVIVAATLIPFAIDLAAAGYPKIGHVAGLLLGAVGAYLVALRRGGWA